jgi:hypothetical protein
VPLATPGILWKVPGYLADPMGPLTVRWSYLPRAMPTMPAPMMVMFFGIRNGADYTARFEPTRRTMLVFVLVFPPIMGG